MNNILNQALAKLNTKTFEDFDHSVDLYKKGTGSIGDLTTARKTIMDEAQRQILPQELSKLKGNIGSIINLIQKRIKPEETGLVTGIAKSVGGVPLKSIMPLLMIRLKDKFLFTNPTGMSQTV